MLDIAQYFEGAVLIGPKSAGVKLILNPTTVRFSMFDI
jgi:hypothetical protein